jgi:4-amino-4-deoxy-L-arabinose transferase-like glycosyltransferase
MLFDKIEQPTSRVKVFVMLGLTLIILLGAFLRFYNLGATSVGNQYYAATVRSMLTSWHNFFFVSFEPGGSVSVDKPPLGFWLEAISAFFLGVNGFALAFPNALAGVLAIPLLYSMVKKQFGLLAGLTSALVLAVTPITIAAERNNTIDGILVFVLLLAAWAVWKSVESGKFRYLLLGMLLVGLGCRLTWFYLPCMRCIYLVQNKAWGCEFFK